MRKYFFTMLGLIIQTGLRKCKGIGKYFSDIMEKPTSYEVGWKGKCMKFAFSIHIGYSRSWVIWQKQIFSFGEQREWYPLDDKEGKPIFINLSSVNNKRAESLRLSQIYVRKHIPHLIFILHNNPWKVKLFNFDLIMVIWREEWRSRYRRIP